MNEDSWKTNASSSFAFFQSTTEHADKVEGRFGTRSDIQIFNDMSGRILKKIEILVTERKCILLRQR